MRNWKRKKIKSRNIIDCRCFRVVLAHDFLFGIGAVLIVDNIQGVRVGKN